MISVGKRESSYSLRVKPQRAGSKPTRTFRGIKTDHAHYIPGSSTSLTFLSLYDYFATAFLAYSPESTISFGRGVWMFRFAVCMDCDT
jgi:hypothetical protein